MHTAFSSARRASGVPTSLLAQARGAGTERTRCLVTASAAACPVPYATFSRRGMYVFSPLLL